MPINNPIINVHFFGEGMSSQYDLAARRAVDSNTSAAEPKCTTLDSASQYQLVYSIYGKKVVVNIDNTKGMVASDDSRVFMRKCFDELYIYLVAPSSLADLLRAAMA